MDFFFNPKSIAVIGASRHPNKIGHVILWNFIREYKGKVYPINPKTKEILGLKAYPSILDVPGPVDLAVIAIPAELVPGAAEECGKKGVKGLVIISGGFSEIGRKDLDEELIKIAKRYGMRIIGPNCIGVYDAYSQVDTLFMPRYRLERPRKGNISFISQSGAVGSAILDWAAKKGFGVSKFISYGNAVDVDEISLLEYLGKDKTTRAIGMYIEGTKDGRKLFQALKKVGVKKPIIAIKGGKTETGAKAAKSHTGALAGSGRIWNAVFKQSGVIQARNTKELFNYARVLAEQPLPKGNRVGIITNGGGFGVLAVDSLTEKGLEIPSLEKKTIARIKRRVPEYAVVSNPVDLVGDADAERYELAIDALLDDRNIDIILVLILFQTAGVQSEIIDVVASRSDQRRKPIIAFSSGGEFTELHLKMLEKVGVPTFETLTEAADAIQRMYSYSRFVGSAG